MSVRTGQMSYKVITKLNLATVPFRNRTTPYLLSALLLFLALVGGLYLYSSLLENQRMNEVARNQISHMREEIASLNEKGQRVQQQLSPMQRELLVASHKLVANKSFGWSRFFHDLESVIPGGVSASRIVVQNVYSEGERVNAELDLTVISRDYRTVMDMITAMNNSPVFSAELRGQNLQSNQRITYSEYTLRLIYRAPYYTTPTSNTELADATRGGGR